MQHKWKAGIRLRNPTWPESRYITFLNYYPDGDSFRARYETPLSVFEVTYSGIQTLAFVKA